MSGSLAVLGALGVEAAPDGGHRASGAALEQSITAARLGLLVEFVAVTLDGVEADLRGPVAAEGVQLTVVARPTEVPAPFRIAGSVFEEPLRFATRREALVCTLDLPREIVLAVLRDADARRTFRVLCVTAEQRLDPELVRECDLVVCDLEAARAWCGAVDDEVGARGLARRLFAFGPRRVIVVDRRGSGSIGFDGSIMLPIEFGARARGPATLPIFTAAVVARLLAGDRPRQAQAAAARCAEAGGDDAKVLPVLPPTAALEALAARPAGPPPPKEREAH